MSVWPAGVAYTNPTMGYQTVNLGFGIEFMVGDLLPNGHYTTGAFDRVDLLANIMEYFGKAPTGPGTGVSGSDEFSYRLGGAFPNPFNPSTTVEYSVAQEGPLSIRVYDVSGRLVGTLVHGSVEPGEYVVVWEGVTDLGDRVASGVYFVRMEASGSAGGFSAERKLILLK